MSDMEQALGEFICQQNPYTNFPGDNNPPPKPVTGEMTLGANWQVVNTEIEGNGEYTLLWNFDGRPRGVRKAMRIKYTYIATYQLPNGETKEIEHTEHLLIGYEGSGSA